MSSLGKFFFFVKNVWKNLAKSFFFFPKKNLPKIWVKKFSKENVAKIWEKIFSIEKKLVSKKKIGKNFYLEKILGKQFFSAENFTKIWEKKFFEKKFVEILGKKLFSKKNLFSQIFVKFFQKKFFSPNFRQTFFRKNIFCQFFSDNFRFVENLEKKNEVKICRKKIWEIFFFERNLSKIWGKNFF